MNSGVQVFNRLFEGFVMSLAIVIFSVVTIWGIIIFFVVKFLVNSVLTVPLEDGQIGFLLFLLLWVYSAVNPGKVKDLIAALAEPSDDEDEEGIEEKGEKDKRTAQLKMGDDGEVLDIIDVVDEESPSQRSRRQ